MRPHIEMLAMQYQVTLVTNGVERDVASLLNDNVRFVNVNMARKVSLWSDICSLLQLCIIFRKECFFAVHSLTPKAGLLAMLAAFFARVPNRIHTFTGQVWANKSGVARWSLRMFDKLIAFCATGLLADSFSQCQFIVEQRIVKKDKLFVLGNGSACGVDVERFKPNLTVRNEIRSSFGIPSNAIVCLFLGRLNKDKGVQDLARAFSELASNMPHIYLLVVGPDEGGIDAMLQLTLANCLGRFHRIDFTNKPEDYMACADIFCLPSYREGFGSVIIEAAAAGVPAVASKIYGLVDAVKDGETGILHQPKNIESLKQALLTLIIDDDIRKAMSSKAMVRAHDLFSVDVVVAAMRQYYKNMQSG